MILANKIEISKRIGRLCPVTLVLKSGICHFVKRQIPPFNTKETRCTLVSARRFGGYPIRGYLEAVLHPAGMVLPPSELQVFLEWGNS